MSASIQVPTWFMPTVQIRREAILGEEVDSQGAKCPQVRTNRGYLLRARVLATPACVWQRLKGRQETESRLVSEGGFR